MPARDPLALYRARRDFSRTPEPKAGAGTQRGTALHFYVQRHAATRLHYDFRLEHDGVLKSWAVPKGPSLDPGEKRLAVQTEDHPLDYGNFEGTIPAGEYGAGDVLLWDRGTWNSLDDVATGLAKGKLHFELRGEKLNGEFVLFRLARDDKNWILRKLNDAFAVPGHGDGVLVERPESVAQPAPRPPQRRRAAGSGRRRPKRTEPMPAFIAPQLARTAAAPPSEAGWVYEVKYDGYRMLARLQQGKVSIVSRNGQDWTGRLRLLAEQLARLPVREAWLDGEITAPGDTGVSSFQALQQALDGAPHSIRYHLFDLLWLDGEDWRGEPLARRHARLVELLAHLPDAPAVTLSEQLEEDGQRAWEAACKLKLEGLIGKRIDGAYESGRSAQWIKLKCRPQQEFVIGGYTAPRGSRAKLGALLVGVQAPQGGLQYAGRVGTGFDEATLQELHRRLVPLHSARCPFVPPPRLPAAAQAQWVRPRLVAQVQFAEWTAEGLLRQAAFVGLREDIDPRAVTREPHAAAAAPTRSRTARRAGEPAAAALRGIKVTHPDRVVYQRPALTKLQVVRYYDAIAEHLIEHLRDRPLAMVRCPQGTTQPCFFQKHITTRLPPGVRNVTVQERSGVDDKYVAITEAAGIVALAQHGVIEMHPWGSRLPRLDRPDRLIIDLDPDDGLAWAKLIEAAQLARTLLEELGLKAFVKTTGGKGLHVMASLKPTRDWTQVKGFARGVAVRLAHLAPQRFTAELAKAQRSGRIFIDYLRNAEGATAVAAFSLRARPGAPVSMPIDWTDLKPRQDLRFEYFNLGNAVAAAAHGVQAWADFASSARPLSAQALKLMASL